MDRSCEMITIYHPSDYLKRKNKRCIVLLPKHADYNPPLPIYYFLHGWGGNAESLLNIDGVKNLLGAFPAVYVFPESFRNWFINDYANNRYESYFIEELLPLIEQRFEAYIDTTKRVMLGYSMGGLAAFMMAATYSRMFCGVCCYAGAFSAPRRVGDPYKEQRKNQILLMPDEEQHDRVWGPPDSVTRHYYDPFNLSQSKLSRIGFIYLAIGEQDYPRMIEMNDCFHRFLTQRNIPHKFERQPGQHDLHFVSRCLKNSLTFSIDHLHQIDTNLMPTGSVI